MLRKYYYRSFLRDELPATNHSNRDVVELTLVRDIQLTQQLHRARIFSVMRCLCGLQQSGWAHKDTSVDTLDGLLRHGLVELGNAFPVSGTEHLFRSNCRYADGRGNTLKLFTGKTTDSHSGLTALMMAAIYKKVGLRMHIGPK